MVSQLDVKHGIRDYEFPGSLPENLPEPVELKSLDLNHVYSDLKPLTDTGPCGYRNEYLCDLSVSMCSNQDVDAINKYALFTTLYTNAELIKWYYYVVSH